MGAKNILRRYMERNSSGLPADNNKLRQHIVAVASEAKLPLSEEELEELVPVSFILPPSKREGEGKKQRGAKSGDLEAEAEKSGNTPTGEI